MADLNQRLTAVAEAARAVVASEATRADTSIDTSEWLRANREALDALAAAVAILDAPRRPPVSELRPAVADLDAAIEAHIARVDAQSTLTLRQKAIAAAVGAYHRGTFGQYAAGHTEALPAAVDAVLAEVRTELLDCAEAFERGQTSGPHHLILKAAGSVLRDFADRIEATDG